MLFSEPFGKFQKCILIVRPPLRRTYAKMTKTQDQQSIATIRVVAADMVQKAKSGHPGAPMVHS
jgi:hypothetical protein